MLNAMIAVRSTAMAAGRDQLKQNAVMITTVSSTAHKKVFFILHLHTNVISFL